MKLEGYAIFFVIFLSMLFSKAVPQVYQFYSFKTCMRTGWMAGK